MLYLIPLFLALTRFAAADCYEFGYYDECCGYLTSGPASMSIRPADSGALDECDINIEGIDVVFPPTPTYSFVSRFTATTTSYTSTGTLHTGTFGTAPATTSSASSTPTTPTTSTTITHPPQVPPTALASLCNSTQYIYWCSAYRAPGCAFTLSTCDYPPTTAPPLTYTPRTTSTVTVNATTTVVAHRPATQLPACNAADAYGYGPGPIVHFVPSEGCEGSCDNTMELLLPEIGTAARCCEACYGLGLTGSINNGCLAYMWTNNGTLDNEGGVCSLQIEYGKSYPSGDIYYDCPYGDPNIYQVDATRGGSPRNETTLYGFGPCARENTCLQSDVGLGPYDCYSP